MLDANAVKVIKDSGVRYISVLSGRFTPDGARALAVKLNELADEAEELDALIFELVSLDEHYIAGELTWADIAKKIFELDYRKSNGRDKS